MSKKPHVSRSTMYYNKMQPFLRDVEKFATRKLQAQQNKQILAAAEVKGTSVAANKLNTVCSQNWMCSSRCYHQSHNCDRKHHFEALTHQWKNGGDFQAKDHNIKFQSLATNAAFPVKKSFSQLTNSPHRLNKSQLPMQRSMPIFELILPAHGHVNLHQKAIRREYKCQQFQQPENGKLKFDYREFLKKISKNKPTDQDVIFGNARVSPTDACGWEHSRIDWLSELERRQELRRQKLRKRSKNSKPNNYEPYDNGSIADICCFPFRTNALHHKDKK